MPIGYKKNADESFRDAVKRIASKRGLEADCLAAFDEAIDSDVEEDMAAWGALSDWDCLAYLPDATVS